MRAATPRLGVRGALLAKSDTSKWSCVTVDINVLILLWCSPCHQLITGEKARDNFFPPHLFRRLPFNLGRAHTRREKATKDATPASSHPTKRKHHNTRSQSTMAPSGEDVSSVMPDRLVGGGGRAARLEWVENLFSYRGKGCKKERRERGWPSNHPERLSCMLKLFFWVWRVGLMTLSTGRAQGVQG